MRDNPKIMFGTRSLEEFGAKLLEDIEIGPIAPETDTFNGAGTSTLIVTKNIRSASRTMKLTIDFCGDDLGEQNHRMSEFDAIFTGKTLVTIDIGDGYLYDAALTSISPQTGVAGVLSSRMYTFTCVRRGTWREIMYRTDLGGGPFFCASNFPKTDCIVTIPDQGLGGGEGWLFTINDNTYGNETMEITGEIVIDGIQKVITMGGENITNLVDWTNFPYLLPGENFVRFACNGVDVTADVKITYAPIYM